MALQQQPMQAYNNPYTKPKAPPKPPQWAQGGGEPTVQSLSQRGLGATTQSPQSAPFRAQGLPTARAASARTQSPGQVVASGGGDSHFGVKPMTNSHFQNLIQNRPQGDPQPEEHPFVGAPAEDKFNKLSGTEFDWLSGDFNTWDQHQWGAIDAASRGEAYYNPVTGISTTYQTPRSLYASEGSGLSQEDYEAAQQAFSAAKKELGKRVSAMDRARRRDHYYRQMYMGFQQDPEARDRFADAFLPDEGENPEDLHDWRRTGKITPGVRKHLIGMGYYPGSSLFSGESYRGRSKRGLGWPDLQNVSDTSNFAPSQYGSAYIYGAGGGAVPEGNFAAGKLAHGTDTVPAMLTPGEFVMSKGAVDRIGVSNLMAMNAAGGGDNKPRFGIGAVYARGGGVVPKSRRRYYATGGAVEGLTPYQQMQTGTMTPPAPTATGTSVAPGGGGATTQGLASTTAAKPYKPDIGRLMKDFRNNNMIGLASAYQESWDAANAANEERFGNLLQRSDDLYDRSMGRVSQLGQDQMAESRKSYDESLAGMQARLGTRGLSGTTVGPSLQQGIDRGYQDAVRGIQENMLRQQLATDIGLTKDRLGVMERRTDAHPDYGELFNIAQAMAAGGQGQGYSGRRPSGGSAAASAYGGLTPWDAPPADYNRDGKVDESDKEWAKKKEADDLKKHNENIRKGIFPSHWGSPPPARSNAEKLREWVQANEKRDQAGAVKQAEREAEREKAEGAPDRYSAWEESTEDFAESQQEYYDGVAAEAATAGSRVIPSWVRSGTPYGAPQPSVGEWDTDEMEAGKSERVSYGMPKSWGKPPFPLRDLYEPIPLMGSAPKGSGREAQVHHDKIAAIRSWLIGNFQRDPGGWAVGEAGFRGWESWYSNQQATRWVEAERV